MIIFRCEYIDLLSNKLQAEHDSMETDGVDSDFNGRQVSLRLAQSRSATDQDNFPVALKQLKQTRKVQFVTFKSDWVNILDNII